MEAETYRYPVPLGIAYIFLGGYILRSLFVTAGLPASVGVILSGFLFQHFFQSDLFFARDALQELSFFLVLLIAGLEIRFSDLNWAIFAMAILPASCEVLGITVYATIALGYTPVEGMVLAAVLVALGDGLVIPKMKEFGQTFPKHPMPRLVFTWAPLEASFALTLFGILTGFASPAHQHAEGVGMILFANLLRITATVLCGTFLGAASGWLIPRRSDFHVNKTPLFNGGSAEAFLMVLAVELVAFALGKGGAGNELVPMGFCPGSMFQSELLVIVTGTVFAYFCDSHQELLHDVENTVGQVWVFGQLVLFSMLGSKTTPGILPHLGQVLPIMAVGLSMRFIGVFVAIVLTARARGCECFDTAFSDAAFCFLSTLPRATIQGALGAVPLKQDFFHHGYVNKQPVQEFIFTAARLYILLNSVTGMILLNTLGPLLLKHSEEAHSRRHAVLPEYDDDPRVTLIKDETDLLSDFAANYNLDAQQVKDFIRQQSQGSTSAGALLLAGQDLEGQGSVPQVPHADSRNRISWVDASGLDAFESRVSSSAEEKSWLREMPGIRSTVKCEVLHRAPLPDEKIAVATPPLELPVRIPEGFKRGATIRVAGPHGTIALTPPGHLEPGDNLAYKLQPEPDFQVTVPPGMKPGSCMQFKKRGDGVVVRVTVPEGLQPMDSFNATPPVLMVRVPEAVRPGSPVVFRDPSNELGAGDMWFQAVVPQRIRRDGYFAARLPLGMKYVTHASSQSGELSCIEYICQCIWFKECCDDLEQFFFSHDA